MELKNLVEKAWEDKSQLKKKDVGACVRVMMALKYGMKEKELIKKLIVILVGTRLNI